MRVIHPHRLRVLSVLLAVVCLLLGAAAQAAPLPAWAIPMPGLGTLALYGGSPEKAIHNYVEGVIRRGVFPRQAAELRAWGRQLAARSKQARPLAETLTPGQPVSGIQLNNVNDLIGDKAHHGTRKAYAHALAGAGVASVFFPPGDSGQKSRIEQRLASVHHLHLVGGDDLHPELWGGEVTHAHIEELNLVRDRMEAKVVGMAIAAGMPVDATCRGYQLLNVMSGGTMVQDIVEDHLSVTPHFGPGFKPTPHAVHVERGSAIAATVGTKLRSVKSMHHEALGLIAKLFKVVGRAPDGVPEMIEGYGGRVRGNQFHAELARRTAYSRAIYRNVAERARAYMQARR